MLPHKKERIAIMRRTFNVCGHTTAPVTIEIPGSTVQYKLSKELAKLEVKDVLCGAFIGNFCGKNRTLLKSIVSRTSFGTLSIKNGKFSIVIRSDNVSTSFWEEILDDVAGGKFTFTVSAA